MDSLKGLIEAAVLVGIGGGLYFLPWIVAARRGTVNLGAVIVIDLLLGWTFVGWVVALAMAAGGAVTPEAQRHRAAIAAAAPPCPYPSPCPHPAWAHRWRSKGRVVCTACPCGGPVTG